MKYTSHLFKFFIIFLTISLLYGCNEAAVSPYPEITVTAIAPLPGVGRASAVAFAIGNKGYITLGRDGIPSDSLKECWEYDPILNTWTIRTTFPGVARVRAIATVLNGKAYIGLGYKREVGAYSGGNLHDFWCYTPTTDSWERKADLPTDCTNACFCFVVNNEIYVGAGFNGSAFKREFWKFNPAQNTWTMLNELPGKRGTGSVGCAGTNHSFFGSGYNTTNKNDWWEYFPATDSWKQRKDMPDNGRENGLSMAIGDRYFVGTGRHFGGTKTGGCLKSDIIEYDANQDVWYERGNIPGGRETAVCFIINGKAYIGLGENDIQLFNDFWCFDPCK